MSEQHIHPLKVLAILVGLVLLGGLITWVFGL